jgi:hypothetical protein
MPRLPYFWLRDLDVLLNDFAPAVGLNHPG